MKTQDPLEEFIHNMRSSFDDATPDPALWEKLSENLDKDEKKVIPWRTYLIRMAAVITIFGLSWFIHDIMDSYQVERDSVNAVAEAEYSPEARELLEAEVFYSNQISEMQEQVFVLTSGQPELQREINIELSELDTVYAELKRDLKDNAANEEIIGAMIQNYRLKIIILTDILEQLKETEETREMEADYEI